VTSRLAVVFTRRAARHVEEAGRWWRDNRTKAPDALQEELERALQLIAAQPDIGATVLFKSSHCGMPVEARAPACEHAAQAAAAGERRGESELIRNGAERRSRPSGWASGVQEA
jgi:hypothetical protein